MQSENGAMPIMNQFPPGHFCWADLRTPDLEAAKRFYGELFGWTMKIGPASERAPAIAMKNDRAVAALVQIQEAASWNAYVSVENANEIGKRAEQLGGKIHEPAFDVFDDGRISVIRDPGGALLPLWQPKANPGAGLIREPGAMCWNELYTNDVGRVGEFYCALFGWSMRHVNLGDTRYTFFEERAARDKIAGMMKIDPSWGPMPPWWSVHFQVEDLDASCALVAKLGGTIANGPKDIQGVGRLAMISDPQKAAFALFTPPST